MVLQSIRDRLNGIIAIFILAILIIPFAFVGVSSYFTSDAVNSVAVVNDQEITINEFNTSFQNYRRRMQAMLGANFDAELFDQSTVRRQHLDTMIDQALLSQASVDAGLTVANERLAQQIRDLPGFQVDGEFNPEVYQSRLTSQGLTSQQFEEDMRIQMVMNQFPSTIATSAISTRWEMNNYVRLQDQQRGFGAIIIPAQNEDESVEEAVDEAVEEVVEETAETDAERADEAVEELAAETTEDTAPETPAGVDDEAILAWYEAHPDDYNSQEQVLIEYLELDAATMGGTVEVDEELLKARFEQQQARFITPESRLASHILISVDPTAPEAEIETARETAEELAERARAGEDFAQMAAEYSQDSGSAPDGGDLGWVEPGFMVQAFEDGLYALSLDNPISDPVQSGFGWHVIYLRDIRPAEGMSYAEAREILLEEYQAEADDRRFLEQADRLVDIIYEDPTTLAAAAEVLGLEVQEAGPFGRLGGEGIASNPEVIKAAYSDMVLLQGAASDPIDLGDNHLVVIRVKEHFPQALKPLEEVRDEVIAAIVRERALEAARSTAEILLAEVSAGADMGAVAEANGFELLSLEAATRTSPEVPADLR
jgi:peptidyl-prolyl cis-trans isomerase D